MGDKWMDEREDRDWRRAQRFDRGGERYGEGRSFDANGAYEGDGGYEGGRDAVFGERETGAGYGGQRPRMARTGWQAPEYGGLSPAMRRGGYGHGRFQRQDHRGGYGSGGGRFYGDDAREPIYREEYGAADFEFDEVPRGYDAGYSPTRARYHAQGYGQPGYGAYGTDFDYENRRPASGGTGGYADERGYGDGGRESDRTRRFEQASRHAGEFLHRTGERVASWFAGGSEARAYDPDYDRTGARGLGPKGYKRSDERISDDAHERLTDDPWLDASSIELSVSGGEMTLSGTVTSREAKHRAERIVEDISGVIHVQNNLRLSRGGILTGDSTGYGDSVAEAQMRRDDPTAGGTGGAGSGQSTAGRKN